MSRPTRDGAGGRAYLDLRAMARREGRPTDELLVLYVLERFLYRLSKSAHRSRLVLKCGVLLEFADPILAGQVGSGMWDPVARRWRGHDGE